MTSTYFYTQDLCIDAHPGVEESEDEDSKEIDYPSESDGEERKRPMSFHEWKSTRSERAQRRTFYRKTMHRVRKYLVSGVASSPKSVRPRDRSDRCGICWDPCGRTSDDRYCSTSCGKVFHARCVCKIRTNAGRLLCPCCRQSASFSSLPPPRPP